MPGLRMLDSSQPGPSAGPNNMDPRIQIMIGSPRIKTTKGLLFLISSKDNS